MPTVILDVSGITRECRVVMYASTESPSERNAHLHNPFEAESLNRSRTDERQAEVFLAGVV